MKFTTATLVVAILVVAIGTWNRASAQGSASICCSGTPDVCGMWAPITQCPDTLLDCEGKAGWPWIEAIHATLTNTGKIFMFKNTRFRGSGFVPFLAAYYWDPVTQQTIKSFDGSGEQTASPNDMFCGGTALLPDGKVILVGGEDTNVTRNLDKPTGNRAIYLFDQNAVTLTSMTDMQYKRWYATPTLLHDGRMLIVGGVQQRYLDIDPPQLTLAETTEVYTPRTNVIASFGARRNDLTAYEFVHLLPGTASRVLTTGPGNVNNHTQRVIDSLEVFGDIGGSSPSWTVVASPQDLVRGGSHALFATSKGQFKILKSGGLPPGTGDEGTAVTAAEVITIDPTTGQVNSIQATGSMSVARTEHNLTILADGKVLATGGLSEIVGEQTGTPCSKGVFNTELWDPATGVWSCLAVMQHRSPPVPRTYHSIALLLPDGTVLSAGGECDHDYPDNVGTHEPLQWSSSADLYYPPYLMTGSFGIISDELRPFPTNVPQNVAYGEGLNFTRTVGSGASDIPKMSLIRPGSVTHANDTEARCVPFVRSAGDFTESGNTIDVPASKVPGPKTAPPGYYMLFLLNNSGRPSYARWVTLWGIVEESVAKSLQVNPGNTFTVTVTWVTTVKASEGDELVLTPPGGGAPITVTATPSDPTGLTHSITYTGTCTPNQNWSYVAKSKRLKFDAPPIGGVYSTSASVSRTFKATNCIE